VNALPRPGRAFAAAAALVALAAPAIASAQHAQVQLENRSAYAGLPFVIDVAVDGFDETPAPAQPPLAITGATVTPIGVQPNVQQRISIINGNRTDLRQVTYVLRYRVDAPKAGTYQIPPVTVVQGAKRAQTQAGSVRVQDVPASQDMKIVLVLPDRPLSVGESVPFEIQWLLRRSVQNQVLSVPLFEMPDSVQVAPAPANGRRTFEFPSGGRTLALPYDRDEVTVGGGRYTRFRFQGLLTPLREGTLTVPPTQAVAQLEVGVESDGFGFPTARVALQKASDTPRTLTVRPLPLSGRPPSFAGAVGTAFSIAVQASRSVVSRGEPVELTITIKSNGRLDGLALPPLDGPGALPKDQFSVPSDAPAGELSEDGKQKTFRVSVRVVGPATQIPPIPFSYFDPSKNAYFTVSSQPIALSVQGGGLVGASDVVSGNAAARSEPAAAPSSAAAPAGGGELSLVGADLSLSGEGGHPAVSVATVRPVLIALYLLPLLVLLGRIWQVRTRRRRGEASGLRAARRRVDDVLARAAAAPGRETAGALAGALRDLARAGGAAIAGGEVRLLERIETEGFAPSAAAAPMPTGLRDEAAALADRLLEAGRRGAGPGAAAAVLLLALLAAPAHAAGPSDSSAAEARVAEARQSYQRALTQGDPSQRQADFRQAAEGFAAALASHPGSAPLHDDWGNASLGAGDVGTATLAYRRALRIDPSDERASRNLSWLRSHLPEWLPRPATQGAVDALFFWHHGWTRTTRHLVAAIAFALAALLLAPWSPRRQQLLRRLALAPALLWLAMAGSLALEGSTTDDAVVMQAGVTLRAADSAGAPAALSSPLPAGAEVGLVERRGGWSRVRLANGATGWLPDAAVAAIER
jgi:hypothetical protein